MTSLSTALPLEILDQFDHTESGHNDEMGRSVRKDAAKANERGNSGMMPGGKEVGKMMTKKKDKDKDKNNEEKPEGMKKRENARRRVEETVKMTVRGSSMARDAGEKIYHDWWIIPSINILGSFPSSSSRFTPSSSS